MRTPPVLALILLLALAPSAAADEGVFQAAAPAPEVTSAPTTPDNDVAPVWSFSASDVSTFECSLSRDDTVVGDWAPCASPVAYDLSAQPDGAYTFAVRAQDAAGVASQTATSLYTLDTSVPALPTIVALPGPVAADQTPEWTFAGAAGESFECRMDRGSRRIADWAPCSNPHEADLTGQGDGTFVFSVRGVAENGTRGPVRTDGYALDRTPPDAPDISSSPAAVGNGRSPVLAFDAESAAQVECRLTSAGSAVDDWKACESPHSYDLDGRADGAYALELRATDAAGNTGAAASADYILDATAPDPPAVDQPSVTPSTKLQPGFDFADDPLDTYECSLDGPGGYATGWQACTSPAPYDLTGQPDGTYAFSVRGTDAAGNTGDPGTVGYELARDPAAIDLRSGPGRTGRMRQPRWSFRVGGGSTFVCSLDGLSGSLYKPATCGSPRTYDLSGRPDGTYTFTVRATGGDGQARDPATQEYQLDSTPPSRPGVKAEPVSPAPGRTPGWGFSGDDGARLDCRVARDGATVVDWTSCTNPRRFDLGGASDGDYLVSVRARDAAGNVSSTVTSEYELDSTPPAVPILKAGPAADDIDRSPTWTFDGEDDALFTCTLTRAGEVVAPKSSCAGAKTYNLSGAQPGTYRFSVEATDAAGNKGEATVARYKLAAAPAKNAAGGGAGAAAGSGLSSNGGGGPTAAGGPAGAGASPGGGTARPSATGGSRTPTTSAGARTSEGRPSGARSAASQTPAAAGVPTASPAGATGASDPASRTTGRDGRTARRSDGDGNRSLDDRGLGQALKDALGGATRETTEALTSDVGRVVFPVSILFLLGGFLLVQSRIDRNDPKLAMSPIDGAPDLKFGPPPTRR